MHVSIVLIVLLSYTLQVQAWGSLGHRTVAYLASLHLTSPATHLVNTLLNNQDISEAALFADKVRHMPQFSYSANWHFIDAHDSPPHQCGINMTRDCLTSEGGCIISAIANHTSRLTNPNLSMALKGQSLRFMMHFFGDVHQPLHTEAEDRGGNDIPVIFDRKSTNLHSVWDTLIPNKLAASHNIDSHNTTTELETAMLWAQRLHDHTPLNECLADAAACALEWASEANSWVCKYVLKDDIAGLKGDLGGVYYQGAVPIVDDLIRKAGRRLAAWLNVLAESSVLKTNGSVDEQ